MPRHPAVEEFGEWLQREYRADGRWDRVEVLRGDELPGAELAVRLWVGDRSYYEVRADTARAEVQAGFATEDRNVNEEIEEAILSSGGDLDDLLGEELCDLGAEEMPMEHFFERPAFRFVVRIPLAQPETLQDAAFRKQVQAILQASHILFQDCVDSE